MNIPELLKLYPAPWYPGGDGVKNYQGIWIVQASHDFQVMLCELANTCDILHRAKAQPEPKPEPRADGHVLYMDGDDNIPDAITDNNGEVVLGLCKVCGAGERELDEADCMTHAALKGCG